MDRRKFLLGLIGVPFVAGPFWGSRGAVGKYAVTGDLGWPPTLSDIIYHVTPHETPLLLSVNADPAPKGTHDWIYDDLRTI